MKGCIISNDHGLKTTTKSAAPTLILISRALPDEHRCGFFHEQTKRTYVVKASNTTAHFATVQKALPSQFRHPPPPSHSFPPLLGLPSHPLRHCFVTSHALPSLLRPSPILCQHYFLPHTRKKNRKFLIPHHFRRRRRCSRRDSRTRSR